MHCFTCKNGPSASLYYPTTVPDKYKIRCYRCDSLDAEGKPTSGLVKIPLRNSWIPPPLPPTRKNAQKWAEEEKRVREEKETLRRKQLWEEQHETTSFNMLIHPPINYGGKGEDSIPHLPRIYSYSISNPSSLTEPTSLEARKKKNKKKRERRLKKLLKKGK